MRPSILFLVLAFALFTRERMGGGPRPRSARRCCSSSSRWSAIPFLAVMMLMKGVPHAELRRSALAFGGVVLAGVLPFLDRRPGGLLTRTRSSSAPAPTGSSATASRRCSCGRGSSTTATARTRSRCWRWWLWLPLTAWLLGAGLRRSRGAVDGRGGVRHLDPGPAVHRPHLQPLLPAVADDGRGRGGAASGASGGGARGRTGTSCPTRYTRSSVGDDRVGELAQRCSPRPPSCRSSRSSA